MNSYNNNFNGNDTIGKEGFTDAAESCFLVEGI